MARSALHLLRTTGMLVLVHITKYIHPYIMDYMYKNGVCFCNSYSLLDWTNGQKKKKNTDKLCWFWDLVSLSWPQWPLWKRWRLTGLAGLWLWNCFCFREHLSNPLIHISDIKHQTTSTSGFISIKNTTLEWFALQGKCVFLFWILWNQYQPHHFLQIKQDLDIYYTSQSILMTVMM